MTPNAFNAGTARCADILQLSTIHTSSGTDVILEGLGPWAQNTFLFKNYNAEGLAQVEEAVG